MKTAVIYARYSSDNQTEQSIEGQLRVCNEYAQRNEILILDTYIDRAMTGTNDNRPAFQQMLKDSSKKEWNYVLVYKLDRFSRDKCESVIHKMTLKSNNVKVLSAMENIPDTPEGLLMESMLEGFNQYFSEELRQKVKRGMRETRLKGLYQGGHVPYGYKLNNRKLEVDEEKREVVIMIYEKYANGVSVGQIVKELTEKGIMNNSRKFEKNVIYRILSNERYMGAYKFENEVVDNIYPQIITKDLFDKVNKARESNHYGKRSVKSTYIFKNKLKCGYCGKPISAECGKTKAGKCINYYKCCGIKKYRNGCIKESVRQEILEEYLLNTIISKLKSPSVMNQMIDTLLSIQKDTTIQDNNLRLLSKSKKQAEAQLNNIMKAVEMGVVNNTTATRMRDLEQQISIIEQQMIVEKSKISFKIRREDIEKFYEEALKQEPIMLVNSLVKEIKLYNDKVEITFNSPIRKDPEIQDLSFLSFNQMLSRVVKKVLVDTNMNFIFYV